ncbi:MAG: hypothetical protein R3226_10775, partial [Halomonas venusta]|nr:hypothetical protein [Halomonas venusta]
MNKANFNSHSDVSDLRSRIRSNYDADEAAVLHELIERIKLSEDDRRQVAAAGANYVQRVRKERSPSMM